MWKTFIISLIGLSLTLYLFKNKKWTQGTWIGCFSLAIFLGGTVQVPQISASIQNSFNIFKRIEQIENELRNLRLDSAEIKQLTVTQKLGTALHVAGDALFDEGIMAKSKNNRPGEIILLNKNGDETWKITILENNLVFQKLEDGKWITKYSIPS